MQFAILPDRVGLCFPFHYPLLMMKRLTMTMMALMWLANLSAQTVAGHWIGMSRPDSLSHVWFRQTYVEQGLPQTGQVTVVSPGYYKLYVNACNVGTALCYPPRPQGGDSLLAMTFDVTPYLRPDTNVIALCYAPVFPHVDSCQVSVAFFGEEADGRPFCRVSDRNWLCRPANSRWTAEGGEWVDGRHHHASWKQAAFDAALWTGAEERTADAGRQVESVSAASPVLRHVHTAGYRYFDRDRDDGGVAYEFGTGFHGALRLTLREARRGEHIVYDGLEYVCNGELDEQMMPVFRMADYRRVHVCGDRRFRVGQITSVEALQTAYEPDAALLPW